MKRSATASTAAMPRPAGGTGRAGTAVNRLGMAQG